MTNLIRIARIKNQNSFLLGKGIDNRYYPKENNWQNLKLHQGTVHILGWISETKVENWGCVIKNLKDMSELKK